MDDKYNFLTRLRSNRKAIFIALPFCGGALGSILAELFPASLPLPLSKYLLTIIHVSIWSALISMPLTLALFWSDLIYRRGRLFNWKIISQALIAGAVVGAVSGGVAQCVYSLNLGSGVIKHVILRSLCWGIMGGLLGAGLSLRVPNLGAVRGALAGVVGGILGGIGFVALITILPQFLGRMVGVGILGASLGFVIVTVEQYFRSASLAVLWGPRETTSITLGPKPVSIGGGEDHVWLKGLPAKAYLVWMEHGKIFCRDQQVGRQVELKDKSTFTVARVQFQILAGGTAVPPQGSAASPARP